MLEFTSEQKQVICHLQGHSRVIAVAGSGKTKTLIGRLDFLCANGVLPQDILVLMYNRMASQEFRARLGSNPASKITIVTFHALASRMLQWFQKKNVVSEYRFTSEDSEFQKIFREASYSQTAEDLDSKDFSGFVTFCKSAREPLEQMTQKYSQTMQIQTPKHWVKTYKTFEDIRKQKKLLFFDDLLPFVVETLKDNQELHNLVAGRKAHILVDEVQDINPVQTELLKIIAHKKANVMVVGDPDQCIYSFRGATPQYLTHQFQHDFTPVCDYYLSQTFRYGPALSSLANLAIAKNPFPLRQSCTSHPDNIATQIDLIQSSQEAEDIADLVSNELERASPQQIAILVRLSEQIPRIELALYQKRIPIFFDAEDSVFRMRPVIGILAWLSLCAHGMDPRNSYYLASWPACGVSGDILNKIHSGEIGLIDGLKHASLNCREMWQRRQIEYRIQMILNIESKRKDLNHPAFLMASLIRELGTGAQDDILNSFLGYALQSKMTTAEFLSHCQELGKTKSPSGVRLITIHRSKGLEWPIVILPGLVEKYLPCHDGEISELNLQSERRLYYVALTRAIQKLFLFTSTKEQQIVQPMSRFLFECKPLINPVI